MKGSLVIALVAMGFGFQASAAKLPFYQSLDEIKAIVESQALQDTFEGKDLNFISSMVQATDDEGGYIVTLKKCSARATAQYKPGIAGSVIEKILVSPADCE